MKKKIFAIILIFSLAGLFFGDETEDQRYTQICTQGFKGYQKFRGDYGAESRKQFWKYFYNLILNFKVNKKFGNIIACSEFWDELKQDELFDFDEDARADKDEINDIFAGAKNEYRKDFKDRMFALDPIDLEPGKDPDKIEEYTADKEFTRIIEIYAYNYIIISKNPLPKQEEIDDIDARWQEMSGDNRVKDTIKKPIDDYFNQLAAYYRIRIKETETYDQKLDISRNKKTKLEEIKKIAASIDKFNIKKQLTQISKMIRTVDSEVKYWQRHKTVDDMIAAFERKQSPTLDDLYDTKKKVMAAAQRGKKWLPSLFKQIKFLWELPEKRYLTIKWYEKKVAPYLNDNNKVIEVFKTDYKNRLFGEVVKKMNDGGNSIEDIREIEILTEKYKKLFNIGTGKENCISLIRRYYDAKERLDYPGMMKLYDENPDILSACDNLVRRAWNLKNSKEAVDEEYKRLYSRLMHKALDDDGRKDETTFDDFWLIHQKKYWKLPKEYQKKFDYLYTFFKSPNLGARQKAQEDLHQDYPHLAYSYRIPDPRTEITSTGDGREYTGHEEVSNAGDQAGSSDTPENDYKKLVKMWRKVKKMKTEYEAVKYILNQAPLRIKGSTSAEETLGNILKWHNRWKNVKNTFIQEFEALAMIGEMLTWSDNIRDQNELYSHIIIRMSEANITRFQMPEPEQNRTMTLVLIKKYIDNNNEYLNLLNENQRKKALDSIEKSLRHEFLTVPQKIRAYYQFGTLSSTIRRDLQAPPCYHFAKAWELMHEKGYTKLNLDWHGRDIIWKSDLAKKICLYCKPVKQNQAAMNEFNRRYPQSNLNINTLCERAGRLSPVEKDKTTGKSKGIDIKDKRGITDTGDKIGILAFLERMFEFVKTEKEGQPWKDMAKHLIASELQGNEFPGITEKYRDKIPKAYDALMNRFFHVIYKRESNWKELADFIINEGINGKSWTNDIKNKMKNILNRAKIVL